MDPVTLQLIIALLPIAERLVFDVGGKLIEINTKDLTDPVAIAKALDAAKAEGFPQLKFVSAAGAQ
jgi:hypothetical protein